MWKGILIGIFLTVFIEMALIIISAVTIWYNRKRKNK